MSSYCYRNQITFFEGLDFRGCFCHLLKIWNMHGLILLNVLLFGIFSRYRFGGSWSARNELRLIIFKKKSLTLMDK